jgi:hypothetical protein
MNDNDPPSHDGDANLLENIQDNILEEENTPNVCEKIEEIN